MLPWTNLKASVLQPLNTADSSPHKAHLIHCDRVRGCWLALFRPSAPRDGFRAHLVMDDLRARTDPHTNLSIATSLPVAWRGIAWRGVAQCSAVQSSVV